MPANQRYSGQRLERRYVTAASHDDVRLAAEVVARPGPDPDPGATVLDRLVHGQPLRRGLFSRHHDVHAVAALQALLGDGQEGVRVRWEVDADHLGPLVDHVVDETG